jgi:hypothetical protein
VYVDDSGNPNYTGGPFYILSGIIIDEVSYSSLTAGLTYEIYLKLLIELHELIL